MWKRVKKSGYQTAYDNDDKFNAVVRRISSLPFVKPSDLEEAFEKFVERAENLEDADVNILHLGSLIMLEHSGGSALLFRIGIYST